MQIYRSTKIAPNNPKGSMLQQASLHVMRQLGKRQSIIPRWSIFRSCSICNHQTVHSPLVFPVIFGFPHHWTRCSLPLYFLLFLPMIVVSKNTVKKFGVSFCTLELHPRPYSPYSVVLNCTPSEYHTESYSSTVFYMFSIVFHQFHQLGRAVAGWHPHTSRWSLDMTADTQFGHGKMAGSPAEMPRFRMILIDLYISWCSVS